jgi:nitroreductase
MDHCRRVAVKQKRLVGWNRGALRSTFMPPIPAESPAGGTLATAFEEIVSRRRSIRCYRAEAVPDALLHDILHLARQAPSSMDGQPCHFVVVRDPITLRRLAAIKNRHCPPEKQAFPADFVADAPVVIAVCVERGRGYDRGLESAVLATAFLLLAAQSRALGSVYLSANRQDDPGLATEIRDLLRLPPGVDPVTLVPLGAPDEAPLPKTLRPLEEIIHDEIFERTVRSRRRHAP